jgi:hypothetical protein
VGMWFTTNGLSYLLKMHQLEFGDGVSIMERVMEWMTV